MNWPKVDEINANTNAARDNIKENTDTAKAEIKTYTAEEIAAAIETLQAATEAARDMILASLTSGGAVKSVQRGSISLGSQYSVTATIKAVDTAKAVVLYGGNDGSDASFTALLSSLELTDSTTVTARHGNKTSNATAVPYQVIEFN